MLPAEGVEGSAGLAHLVEDPADPASADIAVTVLDDWQGRGVGTALVSALMQRRPAAVTRLRTLNHDLTVKWVEAASALSGVAGEQVPPDSPPYAPAWRTRPGS